MTWRTSRACSGVRSRKPTSSVRRSEEHTSELQSRSDLVCRLLLEKKKKTNRTPTVQQKKTQPNTNHSVRDPGAMRQKHPISAQRDSHTTHSATQTRVEIHGHRRTS